MGTPARREHRGLFPELFDWLDWPPVIRPHQQPIRFEDYVKEGRYVVRAELPGIDPEKDVEITLRNGVLTLHAERREEVKEHHRTEFRYGSFTRSITLPPGADDQDVKAVYDKGILEISVKLPEEKQEARRIQIQTQQ
ncbi:Hsp20/alpha crystallin family protein [Nonomuraea indica]|uniref:Hsp20/alpha crystallin family protein n=1 Tax=Nonomuraea indica TaxID=1581193 RepID=UPI000C7A0997|nr:Hsp20/alpha crystallin family protein [Nonomuraea indica]